MQASFQLQLQLQQPLHGSLLGQPQPTFTASSTHRGRSSNTACTIARSVAARLRSGFGRSPVSARQHLQRTPCKCSTPPSGFL
ncbi:hypothetical protein [Microcoleus sp.]|uniref:hypothetical protein n=1 Tax=Microcoleus sp. TaxID=44472 RepID=UPI003C7215C4